MSKGIEVLDAGLDDFEKMIREYAEKQLQKKHWMQWKQELKNS